MLYKGGNIPGAITRSILLQIQNGLLFCTPGLTSFPQIPHMHIFDQTPILRNGRRITRITQNAQGCQSGTNRIMNLHPSKISNPQKNSSWTPKPRSPEKGVFTTGLLCTYYSTLKNMLLRKEIRDGYLDFFPTCSALFPSSNLLSAQIIPAENRRAQFRIFTPVQELLQSGTNLDLERVFESTQKSIH